LSDAKTPEKGQWRLGLIGCGRVGRFCLERFQGWPRLRATAVADAVPAAVRGVARDFGLSACATPEELLARPDVDLVLISTPPDTHYALTLQAVNAGKHVVCEKPLAMTLDQADEMIARAGAAKRLLVVNHMLRYSTLLDIVRRIVDGRLLGQALHFRFENNAEDERLPVDHWFWDKPQSGGIFVEHAVHFFDLQRWWFGPGQVLAAHEEPRQGTGQMDRVWCAMRHGADVLGHQYHGFDQPVRLDRAEHRIVFERGEVVVSGWIPMSLRVYGIVDDDESERLAGICGECESTALERYEGEQQYCRGHGRQYRVTARVALERRLAADKGQVYGEMIRALFDDELQFLENPNHVPRLRADDAREALRMAVEASGIARASEVPS
jgi:predicted dehydrogenase